MGKKREKKGTIDTNLRESDRKRKKNVQFERKKREKRRKLAIKKKESVRKRKKSALFEKRKSVKPKQERENVRKRKKREEFEKRKKSRVERKRKMKGGSVKIERGGKKRNEKRSRKRLKKNLWILKSLKMTAKMTLKLRSRKKTTLLTTTKRKCLLKKVKAENGNLTKKNLHLMTAMRTSRPNLILRKSLLLNPKKAKSVRSLNLMRKRISNLPRSPKSLRPRNSQSSKRFPNPKTSPKSNKKPQVQLRKGVKLRKKKKKLRFGNGGKRMVMRRKKMTDPNGTSWNIRVHFLLLPTSHCPKLSDFSMT